MNIFVTKEVKKTGKAKLDLIFWPEWVSIQAKQTFCKKPVVKGHLFPLKVTADK
jgi:hypothetical protein